MIGIIRKAASAVLAALLISGGAAFLLGAKAADKDSDPEVLNIKNRTRVTVASGKSLKKETYKWKNRNGSFRKDIQTQKNVVVKIRNVADKQVSYSVEYYFVGEPLDGHGEDKIFDRGSKNVPCEPNRNVELDIKSKELTAVEIKRGSARTKEGMEATGYLVIVKFKDQEIFSANSRRSDKFDQTVRELIDKTPASEKKVKVVKK